MIYFLKSFLEFRVLQTRQFNLDQLTYHLFKLVQFKK